MSFLFLFLVCVLMFSAQKFSLSSLLTITSELQVCTDRQFYGQYKDMKKVSFMQLNLSVKNTVKGHNK